MRPYTMLLLAFAMHLLAATAVDANESNGVTKAKRRKVRKKSGNETQLAEDDLALLEVTEELLTTTAVTPTVASGNTTAEDKKPRG
jgi:hypothetical protein